MPMGSTQLRYEVLMAGKTSATMLALPWSAIALEAGLSLLGDRDQVLPGMQGSCGASLGTWLDAHPDSADAYLKAVCAAITWLNHPENFREANRYTCETYGTSPTLADAVRRSVMDPRTGWSPSALIDPDGMETVCRLRTENGRPPVGPPGLLLHAGTVPPGVRIRTDLRDIPGRAEGPVEERDEESNGGLLIAEIVQSQRVAGQQPSLSKYWHGPGSL